MVKDITDVDPNYAAALEELGMSLETFKKMASLLRIAGSVIAAMEIALGIIGVKFCKEIEKAKICLISGFIYAFFEIGSVIASAFLLYSGPARIISFISLPFSLALPVLFLLGAFRNLRSVKK